MEAELVELRSYYAEPSFVLLATDRGEAVGCVGARSLEASTAEIRRLFVRPDRRSHGLGRSLLDRAMALARDRGVSRLVLNTLVSMSAARRLYDEAGFGDVPAYVAEPVAGVQFLGRELGPEHPPTAAES